MNATGTGLSEEQWRTVWRLYQTATDLPLEEARLAIHSATSDPEIIGELLSMLDESPEGSGVSTPAPPATRAGEKIGPYVTIAKLGQGRLVEGYGEAWSGQDTTSGETVVLKFLAQDLAGDDPSAPDHPNIAAVREVIHREQGTVVAMEWVDGVNLKTLSRTKVPIDQTIYIARQVARALAAAHARGIVHGRLGPGKLMLRPDGFVKVLDFGLARPGASQADDVFALGLMMYELLTGSPPPDAALRIREVSPPSAFNSAVPPQVDRLVISMLSQDPGQRPSAEQIAGIRLTPEPSPTAPAWKRIGRVSQVSSVAVLLLAAIGLLLWIVKRSGAPAEPPMRALTDNSSEDRITAAAISPDGKWLAYASLGGIFLRLIENGDTRPLNPLPNIQIDRVAWFPDGSRLLAGGFATIRNRPSLWTVPISGDPPSLLRQESQAATPSPDGSQIAFTSSNGQEIWTTGSNGESAHRVIGAAETDTFPIVLWSPDGKRLAYQRRHYTPLPGPHEESSPDKELDYERSYESIDLASGKVVAKVPNLRMSAAVSLSDGQIVFARGESQEQYMRQNLWALRTDPKTGTLQSAPRRITSRIGERIIAVSAPAHGAGLALVVQSSQADVYVGELRQPGPSLLNVRRLTLDQRDDFPHSWTADSTAVIFESNRNGNWDLFKQSVGDRSAKVLRASPLIEYMARLTPDGQSVLYFAYQPSQGPLHQELLRLPLQGGSPERVPNVGAIADFRCSGAAGKRCIMRSVEPPHQVFHALDPVLGKAGELFRIEWAPGLRQDWDLSADGREISIERWDPEEARIRRWRLEDQSPPERLPDIIVSGWSRIGDLNYSADGKGWFASAEAPVGSTLLYVDLQGAARILQRLDYGSWAVPSPDGRRLAFADRVVVANAWMIDKF